MKSEKLKAIKIIRGEKTMNNLELIELYLQEKATQYQQRRLICWLKKDRENVKTFIRNVFDHRNIEEALNTKKLVTHEVKNRNLKFKEKGISDELLSEDLEKAAGGKSKTIFPY